jgi:hypothetical protein
MTVGAQQIGQQVSIAGVALGAVAAVARARGLDGIGVASSKVSTTMPEGRSMATGGRPKWIKRRCNCAKPAASCAMSRRSQTVPRSSMKHTAWVRLAQSSPAKKVLMDRLLQVAV